MYYLRNRFYDSNIARFISEDPVKDGLNWYAYCGGNPIAFVDPSGLKTVVFCYDNPGSGFSEQVENSAYFDSNSDDVEIYYVTTTQEFIDSWNNMDDSDIDNLYLYLHGGEGDLYFKGETFSVSGYNSIESSLKQKDVKKTVYLFSCHGGEGEEGNNVAWAFAKKPTLRFVLQKRVYLFLVYSDDIMQELKRKFSSMAIVAGEIIIMKKNICFLEIILQKKPDTTANGLYERSNYE